MYYLNISNRYKGELMMMKYEFYKSVQICTVFGFYHKERLSEPKMKVEET